MSQVFYRKYRPERFSDVIGQEHVKNILINSIASNNISHAYLFAGPRGTGKTTIARIFARAINFKNFEKYKDLDFDDAEFSVFKNDLTDIIEMDAASNRGIENIRTLKEGVSFVPSVLKYKVYIIDEAHMLTKESFNALLKTLEEPPEHVVFLFATTEPNKLPVTILSRVIRFDFQLATETDLKSKLRSIVTKEEINATDESLELIYKLSGGSFRDSESILNTLSAKSNEITVELITDAFGLTSYKTIQDFSELLVQNDIAGLVTLISSMEKENIDFVFFVTEVLNELINRSIKNNDVDPKHLELFTEILENISKFGNKYLYLQAKIAANLGNKIESVATIAPVQVSKPVEQKPKAVVVEPVTVVSQPTTEETKLIEKVEEKAKEFSKPLPVRDINNISKLIAKKLTGDNSRLSAIIEASVCFVDAGKLIIENEFQFNINFISKPEMMAEIKKVLPLIEETQKVSDIKLEKVSPIEAEVQKTSFSTSESEHEPVEKKEDVDNSNLVESIL